MRSDLDGELDANQVEKIRSEIDEGIHALNKRLDKVLESKKSKRKKKAGEETELIVKEAQKITGIKGIFVTVDLLTSRIARTCINGMVSAGRDIEEIFHNQVKEYNLNKREQAQVLQLLEDMGYQVRRPRDLPLDKDFDKSSSDNLDVSTTYFT
jgi:ferritin-like metal-binding protein YciE